MNWFDLWLWFGIVTAAGYYFIDIHDSDPGDRLHDLLSVPKTIGAYLVMFCLGIFAIPVYALCVLSKHDDWLDEQMVRVAAAKSDKEWDHKVGEGDDD